MKSITSNGWDREQIKELALTITGCFEGSSFGTVTGNFDGQLMSCGIMQWCLGQGSLQNEILRPFLMAYENYDAEVTLKIPLLLSSAMTKEAWADFIMKNPAMYSLFKKLMASDEMKAIQLKAASALFDKAWKLAPVEKYGVLGVLWAFDIIVQNGSMKNIVIESEIPFPPVCWAEIETILDNWKDNFNVATDNYKLWKDVLKLECEGDVDMEAFRRAPLFYATFLRAARCASAWKKDVLSRKLTLLFGQGYVHGKYYNLEEVARNFKEAK